MAKKRKETIMAMTWGDLQVWSDRWYGQRRVKKDKKIIWEEIEISGSESSRSGSLKGGAAKI
jgi:hypothetical protein